jgi:hypothetical protein
VIVVVGQVAHAPSSAGGGRAAGLAAEIAAAAAGAGSSVELVARIGEDGAGEEVLLALARAGVGHLAVLRDPGRPTELAPLPAEAADDDEEEPVAALLAEAEAAAKAGRPAGGDRARVPPTPLLEPADVSLGLRYLRDFGVVVAVEPLVEGGAAVVAEAAAFATATLVVVTPPGVPLAPAYAGVTAFEAPLEDPDGAFAGLVGRYAAALDQGIPPADAFRSAAAEGGWEPAAG